MIRPFPLDPEFKPLFTTPNHPSCPSAHSCMSSGMSGVLEHLFPADAEEIAQLANESTESRLWGGIHYRIDFEAGTAIGENVAATVIELAP